MKNRKVGDTVARASQIHATITEIGPCLGKYVFEAGRGIEVVIKPEKEEFALVSLIRSDILTALAEGFKIPVVETPDEEIGGLTIAVDGLPIYGEGESREEAVEDLMDAVIEYNRIYMENRNAYNQVDTPIQSAIMFKLLRCGGNREAIRTALGI